MRLCLEEPDITCTSSRLLQGSTRAIITLIPLLLFSGRHTLVISFRPEAAWAVLALLGWSAPSAAQTVNEVQVTPETMAMTVGQRQPIFAAAYDRQGNLLPSAKFGFWSSDTLIARVGKDGTVLGVSPGLAKVEARLGGKRASMAVLITGTGTNGAGNGQPSVPPGSVLTLDPVSIILLPGESIRVTPQALREDATPSPTPGKVSWKSLKPEVAEVDTSGQVVAVGVGKSIIQATTSTGLMATAPVEVEAADFVLSRTRLILGPAEADTLHVLVPSQNNREVRGVVQWSSTDSTVAAAGPTGIVEGRAAGHAEVVATGFGQERRATVVVHKLPQTLVVSPRPGSGPIQIPLHATRQFSAVAQAADSTPIPEAGVEWAAGDTTLLGFDRSKGTATAKTPGITTLTARLLGFQPAVWSIQVIPGVVGLERSRLGLRPGERVTIRAGLLDDQGKAIGPASDLAWSTDHPQVATVSPAGEVLGVNPGHAVVTANAPWGKAASADVFVTGELLVSSNRSGVLGIYQLRTPAPDTLYPLLVDNASNRQAVLSPDQTRVALSSDRAGSYDLYAMDADGRNLRRLTVDPGAEGEPAWTPDGTRIVYTSTSLTGVSQIASIRADGGDFRPLTSSAGGNRLPEVSPDGRTIAFVSVRNGNAEIYEIDLEGTNPRRLTKTSERESSPHFLPGGDLIFATERKMLRIVPGAPVPAVLLQTDQPIVAMDVSRDGERIAYVTGKLAEGGRGKNQLTLRLQSLTRGSVPLPVPLRPGEQVLSPSF